MATIEHTARSDAAHTVAQEHPAAGLLLDWGFSFLSIWLVGGLFLDGWAHAHSRVDDVFLTPWHAVLYSAALAILLLLAATYAYGMTRGCAWPQVLPAGYGLSLIGAALFFGGGALDLSWHTLFGIEVGVEALLSPPHLLLATSGMLMVGGPLRAATRRPPAQGWRALGPMLISATIALSILTFFSQFAHPIAETFASRAGASRSLGISGILIQSMLLVGVILLLTRRWVLPLGALTLLIGLNSALMSVFEDNYGLLPAMLAAGVLADLLLRWLRPSQQRRPQLHLFAFLVPALLYGLYFLALRLTQSLVWATSLWSGAIVLAGVAGLFVSFLVASPLRDVSNS
jgi:hypothetical protein